jgi:hypothetical protein
VKCFSLEDLKCPFLKRCGHLGDPIEVDSSGCHENDQMRAGPLKSQRRW